MQSVDKIKLNFLPISNQNFQFNIWRREYHDMKKSAGIRCWSLPKNHDTDDRKRYDVSFEPLSDFDQFVCKPEYNNYVTMHYIFHLLKKKSEEKLNDKVIVTEGFRKTVSIILKEHQCGNEIIWLEPYYFGPAKKFGFLVDFRFRKNEASSFSREVLKLSLSLDSYYRSNKNYYLDKYNKIKNFIGEYEKQIFQLETNLQDDVSICNQFEELPSSNLEPKKYIFGNQQPNFSQFKGITSYGPIKKIEEEICFFYIFKKEHENLVGDLKFAFKGEHPGVMFNGMQDVFDVSVDDECDYIISDYEESSLEKVSAEIIQTQEKNPNKKIFPIFIEDKNNSSAYYFIKYLLIKEKIPMQVVSYQMLAMREQLKWSVSSISLQIFVKLGGIPWKMDQKSKGLIFGIGQSHQKSDGKILKFFAYSVCADSSGLYKKINVLGKSTDEKTYLDQLQSNIVSAINENLDEQFSRCVLHIPFKVKKRELDRINNAITELTNTYQKIDFVVLRVNTSTQFFGYAGTNSLTPYESTYVAIRNNPKQYLVWVDGLQKYNSSIFKRIQDPIFIELFWSSRNLTDDEMIEYLQEISNLSGCSWRGFNATKSPISIFYCQLIAKYLINFPSEMDNLEKITVPWFV